MTRPTHNPRARDRPGLRGQTRARPQTVNKLDSEWAYAIVDVTKSAPVYGTNRVPVPTRRVVSAGFHTRASAAGLAAVWNRETEEAAYQAAAYRHGDNQ